MTAFRLTSLIGQRPRWAHCRRDRKWSIGAKVCLANVVSGAILGAMTDEEVDAQFSVFAVMLAAPYLNGDHGELPVNLRNDIQWTLWTHGYVPAQQLLIAEGATLEQVARARQAKAIIFQIPEPEADDLSR